MLSRYRPLPETCWSKATTGTAPLDATLSVMPVAVLVIARLPGSTPDGANRHAMTVPSARAGLALAVAVLAAVPTAVVQAARIMVPSAPAAPVAPVAPFTLLT